MTNIDQIILGSLENSIKSVKKNIRWLIIMLSFNFTFLLFYIVSVFVNLTISNILLLILWIIITIFNLMTILKLKSSLKSYKKGHQEFLKKTDYSTYIRKERLQKLKKLFH